MAKAYKATTRIEHGLADGSRVIFSPGDVVAKLTNEQMAQLWEAGALEETVVADSVAPAAPNGEGSEPQS